MAYKTLDISDNCVWCNQDTSFGTGRFVDRISVSTNSEAVSWLSMGEQDKYDYVEGYGCIECYKE